MLDAVAAADRVGDRDQALRLLIEGVLQAPRDDGLVAALARRLQRMSFSEASPPVAKAAVIVLRSPAVDPQPLAAALITIVKAIHGARPAVLDAGFVQDELLLALLERALLPDAELEAVLVGARQALLAAAVGRSAPEPAAARFAVALARQALLNGWMWRETDIERGQVTSLAERLAGAESFGFDHVAYALYRPLADLPGAPALADSARAPWREAARTLVQEPMEERRLGERLPRIGPAPTASTGDVKAQYEAFPYPRWTGAARRSQRPIRDVAAALFPHADLPDWPKHRLDVLVAGCGTGKHAADVVSRFRGAEVTAIDLSRQALGHAARMLKGNRAVRFAEADILGLGDWDRRFDHIESVGVLHHLPDPLAGWRVLAGLLKPGGTMRLGFYSRRGRWRIAEARAALAEAGFHGRDDEDLRQARAHVFAAPEGDPARRAAAELDFYAAAGARDFLFHALEHEMSPAELAGMADALGLRVLGLELIDPDAAGRYRKAFPDDLAMADLRRWDAVEADHVDTFRHMCQFWVVRDA